MLGQDKLNRITVEKCFENIISTQNKFRVGKTTPEWKN